MTLDVDPPDPPELSFVDPNEYDDATIAQGESASEVDYRREELQAFLEAGAWEEAFEAWNAGTDLQRGAYEIALDLGLFGKFDFFWDDFADRVGYHAPGIPEDWQEREIHTDLDSWGAVSSINAELTEFGQLVCETLKDDYIDWEAEYEPPEDLPDFG